MKRNIIIFASLLFLMAAAVVFYAIYYEIKNINERERGVMMSYQMLRIMTP